MGKQYTTAPILVNSNGDPIPQYLDITDKTDSPQGTFKPLTNETIQKVQLTGSYVGYSSEVKPAGKRGDTFLEIDTGHVYIHDGQKWVKL